MHSNKKWENPKSARPECFMEHSGIKSIEGYNYYNFFVKQDFNLPFDTFFVLRQAQDERKKHSGRTGKNQFIKGDWAKEIICVQWLVT